MAVQKPECVAQLMYNFLDGSGEKQTFILAQAVELIPQPVYGGNCSLFTKHSLSEDVSEDGNVKVNPEKTDQTFIFIVDTSVKMTEELISVILPPRRMIIGVEIQVTLLGADLVPEFGFNCQCDPSQKLLFKRAVGEQYYLFLFQ